MRQRTVKLNYTETNDQIPIFISNVTFYMLHVLVFIREAQPFNGHFQVYWEKLETGETPAECTVNPAEVSPVTQYTDQTKSDNKQ